MELAACERAQDPSWKGSQLLAERLARDDLEPEEVPVFNAVLQEKERALEAKRRGLDPPASLDPFASLFSASSLIFDKEESAITTGKRRKKRPRKQKLDKISRVEESVYLTPEERERSVNKAKANARKVFQRICTGKLAVEVTELDLRGFYKYLCDQVLWELGTLCPKVLKINLSGWRHVSVSGMRSVALGFGERLEDLDLSFTPLSDPMIMMLTARFFTLKKISFKGCNSLTNTAMRYIVEGTNRTLISLDLTGCERITEDGLTWLAGSVGPASMPCTKLQSLSLERCVNVRDPGLVALARGCKALRFLNISQCTAISNRGVSALAKGCRKLEIIHMAGCSLVGDNALRRLGEFCKELRSINLARCAKVSDLGLKALCTGTSKLQGLNLAGCIQITELGIFFVVNNNKALQVLNVTGCERVTQRGLQEMLRGLPYVELAKSYTGFKPVPNVANRKLQAQFELVKSNASQIISAAIRGHGTRLRLHREKVHRHRQCATCTIQCWIRGQFGREVYLRIFIKKKKEEIAVKLQRIWRQRLARAVVATMRAKREEDAHNAVYALKIQAAYRGKKVREQHPEVRTALDLIYDDRWTEALCAVVVRTQALVRRKISVSLNASKREELLQRSRDMRHASILIQTLVRGKLGKLKYQRRRMWFLRKFAVQNKAAAEIQKIARGNIGRRIYRERLEARERFRTMLRSMAIHIQRVRRGQLGRRKYQARVEEFRLQTHGATQLQKIFRRTCVKRWTQIKLDRACARIASRTLDDQELARSVIKRKLMLREMGFERDSASEDDLIVALGGHVEPDEDDDWQEHWDDEENRPFYYSPSRNLRTFEKYGDDDFENSLVGKNVKVMDQQEQRWREGTIAKYNRRKRKHRVEFTDKNFDGKAHKWFHLREAEGLFQVYDPLLDNWGMLRHLRIGHSQSRSTLSGGTGSITINGASRLSRSIQSATSLTNTTSEPSAGSFESHQLSQSDAAWEQLFDEETNSWYWYNVETGEVQT